MEQILKETREDILNISSMLNIAIGYNEQIDVYALNDKLHEMFLRIDNALEGVK